MKDLKYLFLDLRLLLFSQILIINFTFSFKFKNYSSNNLSVDGAKKLAQESLCKLTELI